MLVNNAGVAGGGRIDVAGLDEWQWIIEINLFGVVRGTRTFVPMLKRSARAAIVNVASLAGLVHPAGMGSYNAVKAAVVALSETVGHELAPYGVRCSVVCPSYFRTNLMDSHARRRRRPLGRRDRRSWSRRRRSAADDIAAAVLDGDRPRRRADPPRPGGPGGVRRSSWPTGRRTTRVMRAQAARLQRDERGSMSDRSTAASTVRDEDAFDVEAVAAWLREHGDRAWPTGRPRCGSSRGGASNLTYLLRYGRPAT